jgi:hypothetical protein
MIVFIITKNILLKKLVVNLYKYNNPHSITSLDAINVPVSLDAGGIKLSLKK